MNEGDNWMNFSSTFCGDTNLERKRNRDDKRKQEKERHQYNPRECERELNPYWKDGGDGLPKFQKPLCSDDLFENTIMNDVQKSDKKREAKWRNHKLPSEVQTDNIQPLETETSTKNDEVIIEQDLNLLGAKIVKAEIMGNTRLVLELKEKLEKARKHLETEENCNDVLLTHTDKQGRSFPVKLNQSDKDSHHKRKMNVETHKDGERIRYFADDDKYSLKQMFESEKYNSVEDSNKEFLNMTKKVRKNDDLDDIFSDNIRKKESDFKRNSKNRDKAISYQQQFSKNLDNCNKCIQSEHMSKHLMVSMGDTVYLGLPAQESLTEGHCYIIPIRHTPSSTHLDENEWSEIINMRKALVKMFQSQVKDVIFFECAMGLHHFPHMYIECVPLPKEEGEMTPIYFKKAIEECEMEWSHNKKLISLKDKGVRKAIPKGLPYFSVSFGLDEGYAHVIEDEQLFPKNFAQEIIGGMMDLHHSKWKKPKRQSFEELSQKVLHFSNSWKDFDPTM